MITSKLLDLADAIQDFEKFSAGNSPRVGDEFGSISYRNHNPGNLRDSIFSLGHHEGFAVFVTDQIGYFALLWDLWAKCTGRSSTGITTASTIHDLISVYSPDGEVIIDNYCDFIRQRTGFPPDTKISVFVS
jgi:hypothetical protein